MTTSEERIAELQHNIRIAHASLKRMEGDRVTLIEQIHRDYDELSMLKSATRTAVTA